MHKLEHALGLAARGLRVFPLIANGKLPSFAGWKDAATTDPATIRQWFEATDRNIGILCDGVAAIDLDCKGGKDGVAAWTALGGGLDTLQFRTASGGRHLLYRDPGGIVNNTAGKLGDGIDTRGQGGGYIVAPGSTINGNAYSIVEDRPIALLPGWLGARFAAAPPRAAPTEPIDAEWAVRYAQQEIAATWTARHTATYGTRNNTAYHRACRLWELGVPEADAIDLLADFLGLGALPDEGPQACAEAAVLHVYRDNKREAEVPFGVELPAEAPSLAETREEWKRDNPDKAPPAEINPFAHLTAADLMALRPITEFYDRDRMMPRYEQGGTGIIFGPSGVHKTAFVLLRSLEANARNFRVAYVCGEDYEDVGARLRAMTQEPPSDALFRVYRMPAMFNDADQAAISAAFDVFRPHLIFFDTLTSGLEGRPDDETVSHLFTRKGWLGHLAERYGALVLAVDHTGWGKDVHERGHSGKRGNTSVTIHISGDADPVAMERPVSHIDVHSLKCKGARTSHHAYFAIEYEPREGVPVLAECTRAEFDYFKDEKTPALTFDDVRAVLRVMGAYGEDTACSAMQIAHRLIGQRGLDPEKYGKLCARIATGIEERATTDLAALARHTGSTVHFVS